MGYAKEYMKGLSLARVMAWEKVQQMVVEKKLENTLVLELEHTSVS